MKDIETCLMAVNSLNLPPQVAVPILKRNCEHLIFPEEVLIRYASSAKIGSHSLYSGKGKFPVQGCDVGVYMTSGDGRPLAVASFDIDDYFSIRQIQGASFSQVRGSERGILNYLNWEMSLLDVIGSLAKKCETRARVISSSVLPEVTENRLSAKKMFLRYDVPAIQMGFSQDGDWYIQN